MGMRATDLAALVGVDDVTVSRWEHDTKPVGSNNDRLIRSLFIKKVEEELKSLIGMNFLKTILMRLPHKTMKAREAFETPVFNIPINQLSKYDYNLMECR